MLDDVASTPIQIFRSGPQDYVEEEWMLSQRRHSKVAKASIAYAQSTVKSVCFQQRCHANRAKAAR